MELRKNTEKPDTLCDTVYAIRETLCECKVISDDIGVTLFGADAPNPVADKPGCIRDDLALIYDLAHSLRDNLLSMKKVLGG